MKRYDVIIIGTGAANIALDAALKQGLQCAVIEKGKFGGTCLTVSENVPNLSLPRAFSGMVRSARKAGGTSVAPPVEGAASSSSKDAPPK